MIRKALFGSLFALMIASNWALAQSADTDPLTALLSRPPHDGIVDTALIFTNLGRSPALVHVQGFSRDGEPTGEATVGVPPRGLAYVLASQLRPATDDRILGHAEAFSRQLAIVGTAVLVGIGTTDLPVMTRSGVGPLPVPNATPEATPRPGSDPSLLRYTHLTFPVIAVY